MDASLTQVLNEGRLPAGPAQSTNEMQREGVFPRAQGPEDPLVALHTASPRIKGELVDRLLEKIALLELKLEEKGDGKERLIKSARGAWGCETLHCRPAVSVRCCVGQPAPAQLPPVKYAGQRQQTTS